MIRGLAVAAALTGLAACSSAPTSVLLVVRNELGVTAPDAVAVRAFDAHGVAYEPIVLRAPGTPNPDGQIGSIVIYPARPDDSGMRVHAQGLVGGSPVSEGVAGVTLESGRQKRAELVLKGARAADRDADGIPDEIDNCPEAKNPRQENADGDASGDACSTDGGAPADAPSGGGRMPRPNGSQCAAAADCASGFCADGFCCDAACDSICRACNLGGFVGNCTIVPAGHDPRDNCKEDSKESCGQDGLCDGAGACRKHAAGTACRASTCSSATERVTPGTCDGKGTCAAGQAQSCAPYVCAAGACKTSCQNVADCIPGKMCIGGSCGLKPLGAACAGGGECESGNCVDGVCCDVASCAGPCRACNVMGSAGSCKPIVAGGAPKEPGCVTEMSPTCGTSGRCDGAGACQKYINTPCGARTCMGSTETPAPLCDGAGMCKPQAPRSCAPYLCKGDGCGTSCATDAECVATASCVASACRLRKMLGATCADPRECMSGFCVDGRCCDSACTETCRQCNSPNMEGRCVVINIGRDDNATMPCRSPRRCVGGVCM